MLTLQPIILNEYWCAVPFSFGKVNLDHAFETAPFLPPLYKKRN